MFVDKKLRQPSKKTKKLLVHCGYTLRSFSKNTEIIFYRA